MFATIKCNCQNHPEPPRIKPRHNHVVSIIIIIKTSLAPISSENPSSVAQQNQRIRHSRDHVQCKKSSTDGWRCQYIILIRIRLCSSVITVITKKLLTLKPSHSHTCLIPQLYDKSTATRVEKNHHFLKIKKIVFFYLNRIFFIFFFF